MELILITHFCDELIGSVFKKHTSLTDLEKISIHQTDELLHKAKCYETMIDKVNNMVKSGLSLYSLFAQPKDDVSFLLEQVNKGISQPILLNQQYFDTSKIREVLMNRGHLAGYHPNVDGFVALNKEDSIFAIRNLTESSKQLHESLTCLRKQWSTSGLNKLLDIIQAEENPQRLNNMFHEKGGTLKKVVEDIGHKYGIFPGSEEITKFILIDHYLPKTKSGENFTSLEE